MKKVIIKKEMLYSLLIPYIVLGVVATIIFVYMYNTSIKNIHEESIKNNYSILNKISKEMHYLVQNIQNLVIEIGSNTKISKVLSIPKENKSNIQHYKIAQAIQELRKIKIYNSLIKDIAIYYHKSDLCLIPTSIRSLEHLYEDFNPSKDITYEQWVAAITGTYEDERIINLGGQLLYIITIPYNEQTEKLNIIIQIENNQFKGLISDYNNLNEGNLYILDKDFNTIATNKTLDLSTFNIKEVLDLDKSVFDNWIYEDYKKVHLNNKNYTLLYNKTTDLDLQYIWMIKNNILLEKSNYIVISFISAGIAFSVLLLVGMYGVKRNYNKIDIIVKRLSEFDVESDKKTSEVTYINNAINNIEKKIEYQKNMMLESIIRKSLYGLIEIQDDEYKYLLNTNEHLCYEDSILAIFEPAKEIEGEAKELKLNMFVIENLIKELFNNSIDCCVLTIQQWQVLILTYKSDDYDLDYILDGLERTRKFLSDQLDLPYTIGVSSPIIGISQFKLAYTEAMEALSEKTVIGNNKMIYYGDLEQHHNQYYYDETIHKQLLNYIRVGDVDKANETVADLFDMNFKQNQISTECGKLFILDLIETISQVAKEINVSMNIEPTDILREVYSIYDIQDKIYENIKILYEHNNKVKEIFATGTKKVDRILNYIHDNYKDINLNVAMIADCFDLNASYLSRFFKEQTGENLLTYINTYRVERAKELLKATNNTLSVIANDTGFINSVALSRAFKKYEGITPGQYKVIHSEKL